MSGKEVRLFLVDGTPGGLTTPQIVNWTGQVLKGTRDKLAEIRARDEAQRTGVYILLGDDPETSSGKLAYIGQSDDVAKRLTQHDVKKDFWREVVLITSKDMNLTSAHVRYLESELVRLATSIGRVPLENGNSPSGGADLPEADQSNMRYFIDQLLVVLPVLGVDMFRGRQTRSTSDDQRSGVPEVLTPADEVSTSEGDPTAASPLFHIQTNIPGVDPYAQLIDGEFTVLQGSKVRSDMKSRRGISSDGSQRQLLARTELHRKLMEDGSILLQADGTAILTRDVVFTSPSAAAAVVLGRASANGRRAWTTEDGLTYGRWEDAGLSEQ